MKEEGTKSLSLMQILQVDKTATDHGNFINIQIVIRVARLVSMRKFMRHKQKIHKER
jgi:hypothetical protein